MNIYKHFTVKKVVLICSLGLFSSNVFSADSDDLAKELSNPVANLVSVPFQFNFDDNIGADENTQRYQLNIQPVIPIELNQNWNLISRTILPVNYQTSLYTTNFTEPLSYQDSAFLKLPKFP